MDSYFISNNFGQDLQDSLDFLFCFSRFPEEIEKLNPLRGITTHALFAAIIFLR
jgi:hypothetical protein